MIKATLIKEIQNNDRVQGVYQLSEPTEVDIYGDKEEVEFVFVSSVIAFDHGGTETYLFKCDENGNVLNWSEMPGSQRGTMSHTVALVAAGFQPINPMS